jgi:hypothetical protein
MEMRSNAAMFQKPAQVHDQDHRSTTARSSTAARRYWYGGTRPIDRSPIGLG